MSTVLTNGNTADDYYYSFSANSLEGRFITMFFEFFHTEFNRQHNHSELMSIDIMSSDTSFHPTFGIGNRNRVCFYFNYSQSVQHFCLSQCQLSNFDQ